MIFYFFLFKEWKNRAPVVIVPTNYYKTETDIFREWGVNMVKKNYLKMLKKLIFKYNSIIINFYYFFI
jgi:hypothetical protein